ncbi:hypothetical protein KAR91_33755 [Candidatus Pacearchaeota archaeon]|nr:hypothetical protein [Candidatus Pacearchaeota archaeon]
MKKITTLLIFIMLACCSSVLAADFQKVGTTPDGFRIYMGASTDTKPTSSTTVNKGAMAYETDTGKTYTFGGSEWGGGSIGQSDSSTGFGVPNTYSKMSEAVCKFNVVKGNLNKYRIRPKILNEHAESSRETMDVVDAATVVGQMVKVSQENMNGALVTLESAASFASIDAITVNTGTSEQKAGTQEYSSDAEMQEEWIKSGATEAVRSAFTDINSVTQDGSYAIKVPMATVTDDWRATVTSTDLTGVTFSIKYSQDRLFNLAKTYFIVGDGTNTKSFPLSVSALNLWQTFSIPETAMAVTANDDTVTTPDMSAITKIGLRIDDSQPSSFAYADTITYQAEPGSVDLELWNMGASLPASDGTIDYTTGTQYTELGDRGISGVVVSSVRLGLAGGKHLYVVNDFIAGVALEIAGNTLLTENNYYALVLKYVDTDVTVYGPDTTLSFDFYTSGYAWKAEVADDLIDIIPGAAGAGAYSDIMFGIFSTQDIYIVEGEIKLDTTAGGNANFHMFIEDTEMSMTDMVTIGEMQFSSNHKEDVKLRPVFVEKGGKFEVYYNDDPTDSVSTAVLEMRYLYIPPTVND